MAKKLVELGDLAKDRVSGYKGIVTSCTRFLNGCVRVGISPDKLDKDHKLQPTEVFDIEQVDVVEKHAHSLPVKEDSGGDRSTPIFRPRH